MARVNLEKVRELMNQSGYSEPELAEIMEVSYSYLFRVLRGDRQPGGKFIDGLIKAGMSPEDIFLPQPLPKGNITTREERRISTGTDG